MKDTIITIVLVVATLYLVAISVWLIIDLYKDMIECRKAAKRREELIKKWAKMDLSKYKYNGVFKLATKEDFIKMQEVSEFVDKIIKDSIDRVDNCPYKLDHKCQKTGNQIPCHELISIGYCDAVRGINQNDD